jgi:hypothetical protein
MGLLGGDRDGGDRETFAKAAGRLAI